MKSTRLILIALPLLSLAAMACKKEKLAEPSSPNVVDESDSKPAAAAIDSAKVTTFAIEHDGRAMIDMPAPKEHIKAKTTVAGGWLEVDLANLANTRGKVRVDLTKLTTTTFGEKDKDEAQTEHARTWLEAVVDGKIKEDNRWTTFTIESIHDIAITDASKIPSVRDGVEEVRSFTMTAHGDFALHGRKTSKDAKLAIKLHYPANARPDATPSTIEITSAEPLHIVLAEHDVKPRDTFGKLAKGSFNLLGSKVADTADVYIDVRASKGAKS